MSLNIAKERVDMNLSFETSNTHSSYGYLNKCCFTFGWKCHINSSNNLNNLAGLIVLATLNSSLPETFPDLRLMAYNRA
jgi:hypothetical protein